jgi:hypothetical protein
MVSEWEQTFILRTKIGQGTVDCGRTIILTEFVASLAMEIVLRGSSGRSQVMIFWQDYRDAAIHDLRKVTGLEYRHGSFTILVSKLDYLMITEVLQYQI